MVRKNDREEKQRFTLRKVSTVLASWRLAKGKGSKLPWRAISSGDYESSSQQRVEQPAAGLWVEQSAAGQGDYESKSRKKVFHPGVPESPQPIP
jgi:hypothetical protein